MSTMTPTHRDALRDLEDDLTRAIDDLCAAINDLVGVDGRARTTSSSKKKARPASI